MISQRRPRDRSLPVLALIAVVVAALSIWFALSVRPADAAPGEAVPARGWTHETFGRLVFDWTRPVEFAARIENGRLVVEFARPAAFALGRALPHLTGYVRDAQIAPDGRTASFALVRPVRLKSFTDGPKVVVDMTPIAAEAPAPAATAPAPATPAPTASEQVSAAVAATAAPADSGAIRVRAGEHPGFSRLVFDWPQPVPYQITRDGTDALVTFSQAARLDIAAIAAALPRNLKSLESSTMTDRVVARLGLPAGTTLRDFISGNSVVIDIASGGAATSAPAPAATAAAAPAKTATPAPAPAAAAPATSAPATTAPATASAAPATASAAPETASAAPGAPIQLVPPASESPAEAAPAAKPEPAKAEPAKPEPVAAEPGTATATPAAPAVEAPAQESAATAAAPDSVTPVQIVADQDGATLRIDWPAPVAAAAFRRAGIVWLVFDRPTRFDLAQVTAREHPMLGQVSQMSHENASILQFAGDHVATPRLVADGAAWSIDFRSQSEGPLAEIRQHTELAGSAGPRLLFTVPNPSQPIELADPEVGDRIVVAALRQAGAGVGSGRDWPDLAVLATQQGIVIAPRGEGVVVQSTPAGVVVTRPGGLLISREAVGAGQEQAGQEQKVAAAAPRRLFDLAAWRHDGTDFTTARQALQHAIVAEPAARQNIARLDLARFYFAHGLASEATGLLELISRTADGVSKDPELLLLAGASHLMQNDLARARDEIGSRILDGDAESALWRAALAAEGGEWDAAVAGFRRSGDLIAAYPHVTRARLWLLGAEARIESGDAQGALDVLDALNADAPTPDETAQLAFLQGLRAARDGRPAEAAEIWQNLTENNHQPTRARAIYQLTEQRLAEGTISLADAAERMERLRFLWRGGPFEFTVMRRLGELYLADGQAREGLTVMRQALSIYPDHRDARAVAGAMADGFKALYLGTGSAKVPPLLAVALYDEFRELTPAGEEGDRLIAGLADRMVEVDLLERADRLLADQIRYRLRGAARAEAGARLAEIRLLDRRPDDALAALVFSNEPSMAPDLIQRRRHAEARALFESGRSAQALALLEGDPAPASTMLRADMLWRLHEWASAAEAMGRLLEVTGDDGAAADASLDAERAGYVLNRAIALTLAGDRAALDALAGDYGPAMADTAHAEPFKLLTDTVADDMVTRSIAEQLAAATRLQGFVTETRAALQTAEAPADEGKSGSE